MLSLTKDGVVINHLSYEEEEENIAINMLKDNISIDIIMKYTSLTKKAIEKIKQKI